MARSIRITSGGVSETAALNDSKTADALWDALPVDSTAKTWGDEVYFSIPISAGPENGVEVVEINDIAYWPDSPSFCIFFGPTPMSRGDEIRPASAVNPLGRIDGDARVFEAVRDGDTIRIEKA